MIGSTRPTALAPIPFDDRLLNLASSMKAAGLQWEPAVGCFVWDPEGRIAQPSPFPNNIYFVLSMKRFLAILGDVEAMKRQLVWLPTWYQAQRILQQFPEGSKDRGPTRSYPQPSSPIEEMVWLYRRILKRLQPSDKTMVGNRDIPEDGAQTQWVRSVITADLGEVTRLPQPVRDRIAAVYDEVATAYLGWRRIQAGQAEDWLPRETAFDADLLGDLSHFYSDYQTSIKSLDRIRKAVHLLRAIDAGDDRENYDRLIDLILENGDPQLSQREILDRLIARGGTNPVS